MPVPHDRKSRHVVPQNINPTGTRCVPVEVPDDPEWIAMFYDALSRLGNLSRYRREAGAQEVANRWKQVLWQVSQTVGSGEDCGELSQCEDGSCTEIGAFHPALTYYPNNPITQPNHEGPYVSPVWGTGAGYIGASGSDAMIDVLAMLGQSIGGILAGGIAPTINLSFNGSGEIDVQFLATIQGGMVWMFPDFNPLLGDLVNLQYTDVLSLIGVETFIDIFEVVIQQDQEAFVITHSFEFETEGDHNLTMVFFPAGPEIEPPYLGLGGGLRSIQLCGNATVSGDEVVPYTIDSAGDGTIRLLADGVPVSTVDLKALLDDDYVNVEGDTMIGTLKINTPTALELRNAGAWQNRIIIAGTNTVYTRLAGTLQTWNSSVATEPTMSIRPTNIDISREVGLPGASGQPFVLIRGNSFYPTLALINAYTDAPLLQGWNKYSQLNYSLEQSGLIKALELNLYDYVSNGTWQRNSEFVGEWIDDTAATRLGAFDIKTWGYDGEQSILRAEHDPTAESGAKFGAFGTTPNPRQAFEPVGYQNAIVSMVDQMNAYGWTDIDIKYGTIPTGDPGSIPEWRKCSAAYFFAESLAAMIADIFDNLETITTQEAITELIDTYKIPATTVEQVLFAFEASFAERTGVLADLTDIDDIAATLIACDFDRACFYVWIDETSGWIVQAIDVVKAVLDSAWDTLATFWFNVGQFVDHPSCVGDLSCDDRTYDFRFGSADGWQIEDGQLVQGLGITPGFNDPFWRVFTEGFFNACLVKTVKINYHCSNVSQNIHVLPYEDDGMGGYTFLGIGYFNSPTLGDNEMTITFPGAGYTVDLIRIRFESEGAEYNNYFKTFEIVTG